jgi:hypothetical protein
LPADPFGCRFRHFPEAQRSNVCAQRILKNPYFDLSLLKIRRFSPDFSYLPARIRSAASFFTFTQTSKKIKQAAEERFQRIGASGAKNR